MTIDLWMLVGTAFAVGCHPIYLLCRAVFDGGQLQQAQTIPARRNPI